MNGEENGGLDGKASVIQTTMAAGVYTIQVRALRDEEGLQVGSLPHEITLDLPGSSGSGE